jgi:Domain of unknown function (DUF397)
MIRWFKSSHSSSGDGESCVEVGLDRSATPIATTIHIRDSKYQDAGPRLTLTPTTWTEFLNYAARH